MCLKFVTRVIELMENANWGLVFLTVEKQGLIQLSLTQSVLEDEHRALEELWRFVRLNYTSRTCSCYNILVSKSTFTFTVLLSSLQLIVPCQRDWTKCGHDSNTMKRTCNCKGLDVQEIGSSTWLQIISTKSEEWKRKSTALNRNNWTISRSRYKRK